MEALNSCIVKARLATAHRHRHTYAFEFRTTAGRPALHGSEPGQVRKEAATAILCKCRGSGSPPPLRRLHKNNMKSAALTAGAFVASLASAPALAISGFAVEGGYGESVDRGGVA